mmetsp:Transcript_63430/g.174554  ORF Transcript_63430/g.174554 Transcript_63430/m.174554 type:complete len:279 (-) Transcript_63430:713-1549(-)
MPTGRYARHRHRDPPRRRRHRPGPSRRYSGPCALPHPCPSAPGPPRAPPASGVGAWRASPWARPRVWASPSAHRCGPACTWRWRPTPSSWCCTATSPTACGALAQTGGGRRASDAHRTRRRTRPGVRLRASRAGRGGARGAPPPFAAAARCRIPWVHARVTTRSRTSAAACLLPSRGCSSPATSCHDGGAGCSTRSYGRRARGPNPSPARRGSGRVSWRVTERMMQRWAFGWWCATPTACNSLRPPLSSLSLPLSHTTPTLRDPPVPHFNTVPFKRQR